MELPLQETLGWREDAQPLRPRRRRGRPTARCGAVGELPSRVERVGRPRQVDLSKACSGGGRGGLVDGLRARLVFLGYPRGGPERPVDDR